MKLKTERLLIREFQPDDLSPFILLRQDPAFQKQTVWENHSEEYSLSLFDKFLNWQQESNRPNYQLAVSEANNQKLIGTVGLRTQSVFHREAEFGLSFDSNYWSIGYGFESGRAMLQFAFDSLNMHRITAETLSENKSAIKLLSKIGMTNEGTFRQNKFYNNIWYDSIRFSILEDEWQKIRKQDIK